MPDSEPLSEIDRLRAFEMRMQTEGAAGFADGPEPWNQWRETDGEKTNRTWGDERHMEKRAPEKSLCEKMLSAMATVAVATLAVGIGGVYMSTLDTQAPQLASSDLHPEPTVARTGPEPAVAQIGPAPAGTVIRTPAPAAAESASRPAALAAGGATAPRPMIAATTPEPLSGATDVAPAATPQQPALEPVAASLANTAVTVPTVDMAAALPAPAAGTPAMDKPTTVSMATPPDTIPAADSPAMAARATDGPWVVNISSYTYKSMASRKLEEFRKKGVVAEIHPVTINDKPMYRIRTTGYESRKEANTWVSLLEDRLGVDSAWVSKR